MIKKHNVLYVLMFWLLVPIFLNCGKDRIVARVGNKIIRTSDFKASFLADKSEKQARSLPYAKRVEHLNKMIDDDLEIMEAYQVSLDKDSLIMAALKEDEKRLVYQYVIDHDILSKVAPESRIKDIYNKMSKEIKVSQIFIPLPKDSSVKEIKKIRFQLTNLRNRAMRGESFDILARKFSKDSLSAGKGGDVGFIKWGGKIFAPEIYNVIFKMKDGDISRPLLAKDGYHLIKVDKTRKVPLPAYKDFRNKIRQSIFDKNRKQLFDASQRLLKKFKSTYSVKFNDENLNDLLSKIKREQKDSKGKSIKFKYVEVKDRDKPLVEYLGGEFTTGQFVDRFRKMNPYKSPPLDSIEQIKKYLERLYPVDLVVLWGYDRGYQKSKQVRWELAKKKDKLILQQVVKQNVDDKLDISNEQCRQYYQKNANKFVDPASFKIQEILVRSKKEADIVYAMALKKENFDKLVTKYNTRETTKNKNGILGYIQRFQYGKIGETAAKMKVGEISKPIKIDKSYSIFKVLDIKPRKERNFEQVQNRIKVELSKSLREKREKEWLTDLRKKFPVIIYETNLKKALG